MNKYVINGGNKLSGEVNIKSAKNSVLPLITASILIEGMVQIKNCPKIYDVYTLLEIIKSLGGSYYFEDSDLILNTENINSYELPCELTKSLRASFFTVGALLSRFRKAVLCKPGGCQIGARPIDIHINSLKKLGVKIVENEIIEFDKDNMKCGEVTLPFKSVGATENLIMACVYNKGVTILNNVAEEPEIEDLQNFLNMAGAKIKGAGTPTIMIEGVEKLSLKEFTFTPIYDRIEIGTYMLATMICGGKVTINGVKSKINDSLIKIIDNNACKIDIKNDKMYIECNSSYHSFGMIETNTYPSFPTDLQPQMVACCCFANGVTTVKETIFENRFKYAQELIKMGAQIKLCGNVAVVTGVKKLVGSKIVAKDLRGGASLVLACLRADGESVIDGVSHIERGYENFDVNLKNLGANVKKI